MQVTQQDSLRADKRVTGGATTDHTEAVDAGEQQEVVSGPEWIQWWRENFLRSCRSVFFVFLKKNNNCMMEKSVCPQRETALFLL